MHRLLPLTFLLLLLVGCSGGMILSDAPAAAQGLPLSRPANFTLAVSIHAPQQARAATLPRSLRPGRYIVEPDGGLRSAGPRTPPFPPLTRQVSPQQMDQLWRQLRESGLLDPDHPARVDDPGAIAVSPDRAMAIVSVTFGDQRRTLRLLLDRSGEAAIAAERLTDRLAELAWVQ
jgi:hypothetical protein